MDNKKPLVSVIVPNYNHANFLEKRLNSIFDQVFSDYEVIILDDASTDGSRKIIEKYKKAKRIKTIIKNENSGNTFIQWNLGINNANGEYVWIAESDDFANPMLLKRLVSVLNKNTSVGLTYCQSNYINEKDEVIGSHSEDLSKLDKELWTRHFIMNGKKFLENYMISINAIPNASAVIFRKEAYNKIGGAVEDLKLCGDWMTWSKILMNNDVAFIAEPMNYFRVHNSTVRNTVQVKTQYLFEYMHVVKFITDNVNISSEGKKRAIRQVLKRWIRICLNQPFNIYSQEFPKIFNDIKLLFGKKIALTFILLGSILPFFKPLRNYRN